MNKRFLYLFFIIFFFSGFSGLIYESIWSHYLKLFLGHAAYSQTIVLVIFMGGMAIGSYLAAKYSHKWKNLFVGYAIAEGVIGILAMVFHESFILFLEISYGTVFEVLGTPDAISLYKWLSAAVLILPQSVLLGTTFHFMTAAVLREFTELPGKKISLLYFVNSIGAAVGVLISGFVFIKAFGLPGTIKIAGGLNIVIATTVIVLIWKNRLKLEMPQQARQNSAINKGKFSQIVIVLLFVSTFTGMASFMYEIAWVRMLNLVLGTSTQAFELMLSAFIFGLAFGALWIRKKVDGIQNPIVYLGYIQIFMGIAALSTLILYNNTFDIMQTVVMAAPKNDFGYLMFNLASNGIAFLIMLPATFLAGMTLPLITTILLRIQGEKSIGYVYSWNTIGAIIGVIIAVHFGFPILGLKGLINLGAAIDIAIGIFLLLVISSTKEHIKPKLITVSSGILVFCAVLFYMQPDIYKMTSGVYRKPEPIGKENSKVLFYKDGKTASISVVLNSIFDKLSLRTNGKTDASIHATKKTKCVADESTMYQIPLLPMALHPEAQYVANIGLGAGITTKTLLLNPKIKNIKTIEIEEQVLKAVKVLGTQVESVFTDSRSEIIIDDAKSFFAADGQKYDIILSEPSNPWVSGVSGLFSTEFYRVVKQKLHGDGLFAQWLQLYEIDIDLAVSVLKAISENFQDFRVYIMNDSDCLIVAKKNGELTSFSRDFISIPAIAEALGYIEINNVQDLELRYLWDKVAIEPFLKSFSVATNSDYYPILDQNAAKTRFLRKYAGEMYFFTHHYHPVLFLLDKRLPTNCITSVSFDPNLDLSKKANNAIALRDYFLHDDFELHYKHLPLDLRQEATLRKQLIESGANEKFRIETILRISMLLNPYLSTKETQSVWDSLGFNENNLNAVELACLNLSKAIMQKNAQAIVKNGLYILDKRPNIAASGKEYIVSAVMMGYIMEKQYSDVQVIWWKHKDSFSNTQNSNNLFNYLLALSRY